MTTYEEAMRMHTPRQQQRRPERTIVLESAEEENVEAVDVKDEFEEAGNDDDDDAEEGVPVVPSAPQYVTVRTHDKRDGTIREYSVLKGTPVSQVLHQYARDTGVDEATLRARIKGDGTGHQHSPPHPPPPGEDENDIPPFVEPLAPIQTIDCTETSCSWHDVMCGVSSFTDSTSERR